MPGFQRLSLLLTAVVASEEQPDKNLNEICSDAARLLNWEILSRENPA